MSEQGTTRLQRFLEGVYEILRQQKELLDKTETKLTNLSNSYKAGKTIATPELVSRLENEIIETLTLKLGYKYSIDRGAAYCNKVASQPELFESKSVDELIAERTKMMQEVNSPEFIEKLQQEYVQELNQLLLL